LSTTSHGLIRLTDRYTVADELDVPAAFGATVYASGSLNWTATQGDDAVYLEPSPRSSANDPELAATFVVRWASGRTEADTIVRARVPFLTGQSVRAVLAPGWPRPVVAPGHDGSYAIGGEDGLYRIGVHNRDGRRVRVLCRQAKPLPLTESERGERLPAKLADGPQLQEILAALRSAQRPATPHRSVGCSTAATVASGSSATGPRR
jgi:hypothetical protein